MTAEIAILNKTAVALAADSAVTISVGDNQQKVYDSEDKLFELSTSDSIGIMINNDMQFMEAPLPVLIKSYRKTCPRFNKVVDASAGFLRDLQEFGRSSPRDVARRSVSAAIAPILTLLRERAEQKLTDRLLSPESTGELTEAGGYVALRERVFDEQIAVLTRSIEGLPATTLIGRRRNDGLVASVTQGQVEEEFGDLAEPAKEAVRHLCDLTLSRRVPLSPHTGVVVAGFGQAELFPTLVSYEVFGMLNGQLRVFKTNEEDIDRGGHARTRHSLRSKGYGRALLVWLGRRNPSTRDRILPWSYS